MTTHTVEEIKEKLADIEHQRWSDWMGYVFEKCGRPMIGKDAVIPAEFADRWGTQMNTPYANLSEAEKQSDRDQVSRYWHLFTTYGAEREAKGREEGVKAERERVSEWLNKNYSRSSEPLYAHVDAHDLANFLSDNNKEV